MQVKGKWRYQSQPGCFVSVRPCVEAAKNSSGIRISSEKTWKNPAKSCKAFVFHIVCEFLACVTRATEEQHAILLRHLRFIQCSYCSLVPSVSTVSFPLPHKNSEFFLK